MTDPLPPRILVVDDDPMLSRVLGRLLHAYRVQVANGGTAAMTALAAEQDWDAILCDVSMPSVDGPAVYGWLVEHRPHLCGRLIWMSGGVVDGRISQFVEQTRRPVLPKPFPIEALRRAISELIDGTE